MESNDCKYVHNTRSIPYSTSKCTYTSIFNVFPSKNLFASIFGNALSKPASDIGRSILPRFSALCEKNKFYDLTRNKRQHCQALDFNLLGENRTSYYVKHFLLIFSEFYVIFFFNHRH